MKKIASKGVENDAKMIEVRVRFWTNGLSPKKGQVIPKVAWDYGVVGMKHNNSHGIISGKQQPFRSLMGLPYVIEKVLIAQGIQLRLGNQAERYLSER